MKRHNDLSAQTVLTNEINKGKNDRKFSGILIMSPENESEQTCKDKMYKIYEENTPWVVKNIRAADCSLSENQSDCNTLEQNSSQDTCATVSSEEIDSCHSDISTMDHQDSINEKITQFLKWDIKEPIQKQQNEHNFGSLNSDQSQCRLLSGLDDNSQNPGDKKNNIEKTDSCHVCWNEYVEYYSYPLESSMSTIDMYTDSPKTKDIPRTRSHDYYTTLNDINKQQRHQIDSNAYRVRPCLCLDQKHDEQSHSNRKEKHLNFNHSKKYAEWQRDNSNRKRFQNYYNNSVTSKHEPHLNIQNQGPSKCFVLKNAVTMNNNNNNSCQCKTNIKSSPEKDIAEDKKINKNMLENVDTAPNKTMNIASENIKSKNDYDECQLCCHNYNRDENTQDENPKSSSDLRRNKKLRKLLGLKPDEKNVLVMLKL